MDLDQIYRKNTVYVHDEITHTCNAAREILPIVFSHLNISSIIDIGCGIGTWLKIAKELGVNEMIGVDGDYVNREMLLIAETEFVPHDLTKRLNLNRRYDLGICLEVAEHLPENTAEVLIETITVHSDIILFSAAIPGQGGQNHINEQWPAYWAEKFHQKGYVMKDFFRPKIWMNEQVDRWYRQNLFLVVHKTHWLNSLETREVLPMVHPAVLEAILDQKEKKIKQLRNTIEKLKGRDIISLFKGWIKHY